MSLLDHMALLDKRPTWFVKGDQRRAAYYTIQAKELRDAGFVEEGKEPAKAAVLEDKLPEIPVVAGGDAFEVVVDEPEPEPEPEPAPRRTRRKKAEAEVKTEE